MPVTSVIPVSQTASQIVDAHLAAGVGAPGSSKRDRFTLSLANGLFEPILKLHEPIAGVNGETICAQQCRGADGLVILHPCPTFSVALDLIYGR